MNYFIQMKIIHAVGNLLGPIHHSGGLEHRLLICIVQIGVQLAVRTKLHDYAVELVAVERDAFEFDQIQLAQLGCSVDTWSVISRHK